MGSPIIIGFSTHDDRRTHGELLESRQITRQVPEQFIVSAKFTVLADRRYQDDFHATRPRAREWRLPVCSSKAQNLRT